uniref:Putative secreted peptide n=1 Tax=Anopheles braziliensis TaxID=58242 RepID=A0A2M3ZVU1_9DIPT
MSGSSGVFLLRAFPLPAVAPFCLSAPASTAVPAGGAGVFCALRSSSRCCRNRSRSRFSFAFCTTSSESPGGSAGFWANCLPLLSYSGTSSCGT